MAENFDDAGGYVEPYFKCTITLAGVCSEELECANETHVEKAILAHSERVVTHHRDYRNSNTFEFCVTVATLGGEEDDRRHIDLLVSQNSLASTIDGALLAILALDNRVHRVLIRDSDNDCIYSVMHAMNRSERTSSIVKRLYEVDHTLCDVLFFARTRKRNFWSPSNNAALGLLLDRNSTLNSGPHTLKKLCLRALDAESRKRILPGILFNTELTEKTRMRETTANKRNKRQRR